MRSLSASFSLSLTGLQHLFSSHRLVPCLMRLHVLQYCTSTVLDIRRGEIRRTWRQLASLQRRICSGSSSAHREHAFFVSAFVRFGRRFCCEWLCPTVAS